MAKSSIVSIILLLNISSLIYFVVCQMKEGESIKESIDLLKSETKDFFGEESDENIKERISKNPEDLQAAIVYTSNLLEKARTEFPVVGKLLSVVDKVKESESTEEDELHFLKWIKLFTNELKESVAEEKKATELEEAAGEEEGAAAAEESIKSLKIVEKEFPGEKTDKILRERMLKNEDVEAAVLFTSCLLERSGKEIPFLQQLFSILDKLEGFDPADEDTEKIKSEIKESAFVLSLKSLISKLKEETEEEAAEKPDES